LRLIPQEDVLRILKALDVLSNDPNRLNSKPLTGREVWRLRLGQYRMIYTMDDQEIVIEIIKIGHYKNITYSLPLPRIDHQTASIIIALLAKKNR